MDTELVVNDYFSAGDGYLNILGPQPVNAIIELVNIAGQFHHQGTHLVGGHLGSNNIGLLFPFSPMCSNWCDGFQGQAESSVYTEKGCLPSGSG